MSKNQDLASLSDLAATLVKDDIVASYKIQIMYAAAGRTPKGPNLCFVTVWSSGSRLGGGGDEKMYFCSQTDGNLLSTPLIGSLPISKLTPPKDNSEAYIQKMGCGRPIPLEGMSFGFAVCPHCKKKWDNSAELTGELLYKLPTHVLADRLAAIWHDLDGDADLYIKYHQSDERYRQMARIYGSAVARKHRGLLAYPLQRILRDTASGGSVSAQFAKCLAA